MTAYITGTSTRKVDDLVKALGCDCGVSKSTVSRICAGIDADVAVLRTRRLDHQPFVYVWLDATYVHVREHRHVTSKAVVIATGLRADGHREVLGVDVGDSENETFWREFLTGLTDRGLAGVRLVISDAHAGLDQSDRPLLPGRRLAALPGPRDAQPARRRPPPAPGDDRRADPHRVRPTRRRHRPHPAARRRRPAHAPTPRAVAERLEAMEADVLAYTALPGRALVEDLVEQPDRTTRTASSSDAPTSSASSPTRPP